MTMIIGEEKPSLDDLAHFGVMGMKWGQHRRKASGDDIHAARERLGVKQAKYAVADRARRQLKKGTAAREHADAKQKAFEKSFNKDKDRAIAVRMTRGEKAVALIVGGPFGLLPIATSSAVSRRIEKKQDDKAYDKKK